MKVYTINTGLIGNAKEVTIMYKDGNKSTFNDNYERLFINENEVLCYTIK